MKEESVAWLRLLDVQRNDVKREQIAQKREQIAQGISEGRICATDSSGTFGWW